MHIAGAACAAPTPRPCIYTVCLRSFIVSVSASRLCIVCHGIVCIYNPLFAGRPRAPQEVWLSSIHVNMRGYF
jgi:hypothetical protein